MFSIGLRYCGGCNPQIDRSRLIEDLREGLKNRGLKVDFITDKERATDIILVVNGCKHACFDEEYLDSGQNAQVISVKGEMVGSKYIEEKDIPEFLIEEIMDRFQFSS